jgi:diguanylate cyclase (GGDEF)-like protein
MLARIGGDEFAILLPEIGEEQCRDLVARIRAAIERFNSEDPDVHLSISLGYYVWVQGEEKDLNAVFKEADDRMFRDKAAKRSSRI